MIAFDLDNFELTPMAPGLRVSFPVHVEQVRPVALEDQGPGIGDEARDVPGPGSPPMAERV